MNENNNNNNKAKVLDEYRIIEITYKKLTKQK